MTVSPGDSLRLESLRGLEGVHVIIRDIDDFVEEDGLNEEQVYFDVSLKLQKAGIDIIPARFYADTENAAILYVYATTASTGVNYVYNLGLALSHEVSLMRDPGIHTVATTWKSEELGIVAMGDVGTLVNSIVAKVDEFIADHAAANREE